MEDSSDKSFKAKDRLIRVALEQFSAKGYAKASINDILSEAKISKGTFYYHFKNKEDLYLYLIGVLISQKKTFFSKSLPVNVYQQTDIFSLLLLLTKTGLGFARDNPQIHRFSERFQREKGTAIYDKALKVYNFDDNDYFTQLIKAAVAKGEFRRDLPESFIQKMVSFLFTHSVEMFDSLDLESYEDGFEYFMRFLKHGLQNDNP